MGEFLGAYTNSMHRVGTGCAGVDAGLMSAMDPAAFAGPAGGEGYDIPYADWQQFCDAISSYDATEVPSVSGKPPVGMVVGGFGGDGFFPVWFGESGGVVTSVLVAFTEEYEEWEEETEENCTTCGGDGEDENGDPCSDCHGGSVTVPYDENNGGSTFKGSFRTVGYFEVSSGYLVVSDPCYVLTPDCTDHPASLDAVASAIGGTVSDIGKGLCYYCRAAKGRWSASVAEVEGGLQGAVLFERC